MSFIALSVWWRRSWLLACLVVLGMAASSATLSRLIYRGTKVPPGTYMYVVGLTRGMESAASCTGTLISPDIVVTAAHCVCDQIDSNIYFGDDPDVPGNGPGYYLVEDWQSLAVCGTGYDGQDLAIVKFSPAVTGVAPARIAHLDQLQSNKKFKILGFGATNHDGTEFFHDKRFAEVKAISLTCGQNAPGRPMSDIYGCVSGREMVLGAPDSPDTCVGDSGGPLMIATRAASSGDQAFALTGVTSRAITGSRFTCGDGGVYTKLTLDNREWMKTAIESMGGSMPANL